MSDEPAVWVVRLGNVPGEGRYLEDVGPSWHDSRALALRTSSKGIAMSCAERFDGRVVRLRRSSAVRAGCAAFRAGQADERATVVAWLRAVAEMYGRDPDYGEASEEAEAAESWAYQIEVGEHRKPVGRPAAGEAMTRPTFSVEILARPARIKMLKPGGHETGGEL